MKRNIVNHNEINDFLSSTKKIFNNHLFHYFIDHNLKNFLLTKSPVIETSGDFSFQGPYHRVVIDSLLKKEMETICNNLILLIAKEEITSIKQIESHNPFSVGMNFLGQENGLNFYEITSSEILFEIGLLFKNCLQDLNHNSLRAQMNKYQWILVRTEDRGVVNNKYLIQKDLTHNVTMDFKGTCNSPPTCSDKVVVCSFFNLLETTKLNQENLSSYENSFFGGYLSLILGAGLLFFETISPLSNFSFFMGILLCVLIGESLLVEKKLNKIFTKFKSINKINNFDFSIMFAGIVFSFGFLAFMINGNRGLEIKKAFLEKNSIEIIKEYNPSLSSDFKSDKIQGKVLTKNSQHLEYLVDPVTSLSLGFFVFLTYFVVKNLFKLSMRKGLNYHLLFLVPILLFNYSTHRVQIQYTDYSSFPAVEKKHFIGND